MSKREYYSVGGCTPVSREDIINWCDVNVLLDRGEKRLKKCCCPDVPLYGSEIDHGQGYLNFDLIPIPSV